MRQPLSEEVALAWRAFGRAANRSWCVRPAVPILFFGDLRGYRASPLRVATVGLNPSRHEFPADSPLRRFPPLEPDGRGKTTRYLDAMSAYFRNDPYRGWFNTFEAFLQGLGASYYDGAASRALHTDLCSPVATDPTWSGLPEDARSALVADGTPIWHALMEELQPQMVLLSVAKAHLARVEFEPLTDWEVVHVFDRSVGGEVRSRPYEIRARWYGIGGARTLFVFGSAAQKPFGTLAHSQKREAGEIVARRHRDGAGR